MVNKLLLMKKRGLVPGAIAWYRCDEGAGQILYDHSGNGNHGTLGSTSGVDTNDPQWSPQGLVFEGDDFVDLGNSFPCLNSGGPFSIMFVAQTTSLETNIFSKQTSSSSGAGKLGIFANTRSGNLIVKMFDVSGSLIEIVSAGNSVGDFLHGTVQYDGTTLSFYVNSMRVGSTIMSYTPAVAQNLILGKYSYSSGPYYTGIQSGFEILPFALSDSQIAQQYAYEKWRLAQKGVILP